jgi:glycosyltransferase involved in cell wall biosynthesis
LRILHLLRSDNFAGVERYLTYVAPELARRGHQVTVVGGDPSRMVPAFASSGVRHLPARRTGEVMWATRTATREGRPDVVHTHMTAAELAGVASQPMVRRPLVTTRHFAQPRGHGSVRRPVWGLIPHFMAEEIAISQFVADHAGSPCVVIPNGVPPRPPALVARRPVVLVAQRLDPEKDTTTAVHAWALSGLADRGWTLDVAGRGAESGYLVDLAAHLGVAGSVRFLGQVDDLEHRMAEASVLVASAPAEPFGLSVVEAMASRLPVLAAAGGAHPELLGPLGPELLFEPRRARSLADRLVALAADPARRVALGDELHSRYEAEYTVERHVDRLEVVYDRVVGPRGRPGAATPVV